MKLTKIDTVSQALQEGKNLPWAYLKYMSRIYLGRTTGMPSMMELEEGRFFGPDCEIRLYQDGEGLAAVKITDEPGDTIQDLEVLLRRSYGKLLRKRRYLEFDADGQARVACTRLLEWEEV